ncbi:Glu/Leu/Phe/Val family dehydrogenase [Bradyrhizobium sp. RDT10]
MGTNEQVMAWFMDTYSMYQGQTINEIVTGKPISARGTLGRREATGRGVAYLVGRALEHLGIAAGNATAIIQGFGNVGSVTAYSLRKEASRSLVSAITPPHITIPPAYQSLIEPSELLIQKCDVLVPAAIEQVIAGHNASLLRCRILAEGANGPTTPEADVILHQRDDVFVLPDILCNAGGVIVSYFEWVQDLQRLFWEEAEVFDRLYRILERSFQQTMARAKRDRIFIAWRLWRSALAWSNRPSAPEAFFRNDCCCDT